MTREQLAELVEHAAYSYDGDCNSTSEATIKKLEANVDILINKLADCIRWNKPLDWLEDYDQT